MKPSTLDDLEELLRTMLCNHIVAKRYVLVSVRYSSVTITCMKLQSLWEITFLATRSRTLVFGYRRYGRPIL